VVPGAIHFATRRQKKLIAALLFATDPVFRAAYNCESCTPETKEEYGCGGPPRTDTTIWRIDFCLDCNGTDIECPTCKGSNATSVPSCPRSGIEMWVQTLLPYFFEWWQRPESGWPFGNRSRAGQTVQLVKAFEVLSRQMQTREERNVK